MAVERKRRALGDGGAARVQIGALTNESESSRRRGQLVRRGDGERRVLPGKRDRSGLRVEDVAGL